MKESTLNLTEEEKATIIAYIVRGILVGLFVAIIGTFYIIGGSWKTVLSGCIGLFIGIAIANAAIADWKKERARAACLRGDLFTVTNEREQLRNELFNAREILWVNGLGNNPRRVSEAIEAADARPVASPAQIKTIMFFENGNACAFDDRGEQAPHIIVNNLSYEDIHERFPNAQIEDYRKVKQ